VRRRGIRDDLETAVGESRVDLARVDFAPLALDEPAPLESIDQPGQPATAEDNGVREHLLEPH
jgi:hypothetical protein